MPLTFSDSSFCRNDICECPGFVRQIYRPALCRNCFHTIAVHSEGEWREEIEETSGRVYYVCDATGERLFAKPGDIDLKSVVDRLYPSNRGSASATFGASTKENALPNVANIVSEKILAWTAFENAQSLRSHAVSQQESASDILTRSGESLEPLSGEDELDVLDCMYLLSCIKIHHFTFFFSHLS